MEDLCTGCLVTDRKLRSINETGFSHIYSQILNEIPVQDVSQIHIRICWECRAALRRFELFKAQAKNCYTQLLWNIPPCTTPRLICREIINISYPELKVKPEFDVYMEVKKETEDVGEKHEESIHCEPETFVHDLVVQRNNGVKVTKKSKKKLKEKKVNKNTIKVKKKRKSSKKINNQLTKIDLEAEVDQENGDVDQLEIKDDDQLKMKDVDQLKMKDVDQLEMKDVDQLEMKDVDLSDKNNSEEYEDDSPLEDNGFQEENELEKEENKLKIRKEIAVKNSVKVKVPRPRGPREELPDKPHCEECNKTFSSRKTYRYHRNVIHKGQNSHPCPRCGKVYQWKSNLGRHMRSHKAVDSGELYCETCDKFFASVATYRQHLKISRRHVSENEFSYTCEECGKKFVDKTRLRDHIDWEHLKKIKFRCNLCNKPFKCHTSLYVHRQNIHSNKEQKDNLCHVCGKSYRMAAKLKYHIVAMHTGQTPYQCPQCNAAFGWYSSLYRHIREVHYKMKAQPTRSKKAKKLPNEPEYINYPPVPQPIHQPNLPS